MHHAALDPECTMQGAAGRCMVACAFAGGAAGCRCQMCARVRVGVWVLLLQGAAVAAVMVLPTRVFAGVNASPQLSGEQSQ